VERGLKFVNCLFNFRRQRTSPLRDSADRAPLRSGAALALAVIPVPIGRTVRAVQ
jgi:hypothetical protein